MKKQLPLCWIVLLLAGCGRYHNPNPRLTTDNLLRIEARMSMNEVKAILGEPVSESRMAEGYDFYCPCNPEHTCHTEGSYTFCYTSKSYGFFTPHPMVWVHFDQRKQVREIYIKRYAWWDDPCIYGRSANPCDTNDQAWADTLYNEALVRQSLNEFFRAQN